jgi:hypothetical protein
MSIAARKQDNIASDQARGWLIGQLNETFAFGDQMKNHHALGVRFKQRRYGISAWRLIAPRRCKFGLDENGTDQAHHAKNF